MKSTADVIRASAAEIARLKQRIVETVAHRWRSPADHDAWSNACEAFHRRYADLAYPGGTERWSAFLASDSAEADAAITYLEVDPRCFRSGYMKQILWNRLKRFALAPSEQRRLESLAIAYLERWPTREFWDMVRYVRLRGSPHFWDEISQLAKADDGTRGIRAHWLLLAKQNLPVRHRINRELLRARYEPGYAPDLRLGQRPQEVQ